MSFQYSGGLLKYKNPKIRLALGFSGLSSFEEQRKIKIRLRCLRWDSKKQNTQRFVGFFQFLGIGYIGFGFCFLGFEYTGFGFRLLDVGYMGLAFGFWMLNIQISVHGFWIYGFDFQFLGFGYMAFSYWALDRFSL
ncbi:hypothetical protein GLOIN_2v1790346 [Rhizophagus irregularis DAOM 181602=DAOM 197198]|uniref:Uncharacterized protein n=1 Tax=Rhizophagus irregularis (strain DAOM 181602 / DAOM 197198 / MUCL 43194) TaxID=747089 RepID=A0A2P4NZC0_RHIID|nr:hypothetical protein GLOIN_2v1790346 [Rhizophagus irregularis DAOM 181602=DAOM 197198]POG58474.1 hypothetical protein GLOIN_2v1790346 [Rhizophagus irregularis DAOM 181602=DAOM 197198]|eukprot:XP_025165340.1 hypothetical protein GLOIN_2v1790346 [Rhizophagus irregularis DAOM 181602=DAOM 197198]